MKENGMSELGLADHLMQRATIDESVDFTMS